MWTVTGNWPWKPLLRYSSCSGTVSCWLRSHRSRILVLSWMPCVRATQSISVVRSIVMSSAIRRWVVGRSAKSGSVLAFLGARGGAGTTTLVVHLSTFLAQLCGKKVLLVDQHRQLGHAALYLGLPVAEYHFYDLARNIDRVDADLLNGFVVHEVNGVDVLPGPEGLYGLTDVPLSSIQQTIRYLRGTYEYVVIDCCQGVGNANEATIAECDQIYLVATPDVPALRDLSRYVDRLLQYDLPPGKVNVVINRFRSKGEVTL